jgi:hypothetical protein
MTTATATETHPLITAARTLDNALVEWADSDAREMPDELIEQVNLCCTVLTGELPDAQTQQLYAAGILFAIQWQDLLNNQVQQNGQPLPSFWSALDQLRLHTDSAEDPVVPDQKTVAETLAECDDKWSGRWEHVAKEFGQYDHDSGKWSGPFFNRFGGVEEHKIRREIAEPGSVLGPNWVHPSVLTKRKNAVDAAKQKLNELQSGIFNPEARSIDKTPVVDLLQEGQYVDVIARATGKTTDEILDIAFANGITPADRDEDLGQQADFAKPDEDRQDQPEPAAIAEPEDIFDIDDGAENEGIEDDQPKTLELKPIEGDGLKSWLADWLTANPEGAPIDAMTELAVAGLSANPRSVGQFLRNLRDKP